MQASAVTELMLSHFRSHRLTRLALDGRPVALFGPKDPQVSRRLALAPLEPDVDQARFWRDLLLLVGRQLARAVLRRTEEQLGEIQVVFADRKVQRGCLREAADDARRTACGALLIGGGGGVTLLEALIFRG